MVLAVLSVGSKTAAFVLFVLTLSVTLTFQLQTTTEIHNCSLVSLLEQPEDLRSKERRYQNELGYLVLAPESFRWADGLDCFYFFHFLKISHSRS